MGTDQGEGPGKARITLRVRSLRTRLLDADNLAGGSKFFVDAIRRMGLVPEDDPESVALEFAQQKVSHKDQEETVVTIIYAQ